MILFRDRRAQEMRRNAEARPKRRCAVSPAETGIVHRVARLSTKSLLQQVPVQWQRKRLPMSCA